MYDLVRPLFFVYRCVTTPQQLPQIYHISPHLLMYAGKSAIQGSDGDSVYTRWDSLDFPQPHLRKLTAVTLYCEQTHRGQHELSEQKLSFSNSLGMKITKKNGEMRNCQLTVGRERGLQSWPLGLRTWDWSPSLRSTVHKNEMRQEKLSNDSMIFLSRSWVIFSI